MNQLTPQNMDGYNIFYISKIALTTKWNVSIHRHFCKIFPKLKLLVIYIRFHCLLVVDDKDRAQGKFKRIKDFILI